MAKVLARFSLWAGVAVAMTSITAPNFYGLLGQSLDETFGSIFPAIPFAALLTVLLAMRWGEFREILAREGGITSAPYTRLAGCSIIAGLVVLREVTGQSVELSGVAIILTAYGTSMALNPGATRLLFPYAMTYSAGVTTPALIQWAFGEPLASFSSALSSSVLSLTGIPVTWHGTEFVVVSRAGGLLNSSVTPGCSSIISVTTFLGLLALMHFDLKKEVKSTVYLAIAGVVTLTLLNAVRIAVLIWVAYSSGPAAFWEVHNWVGYAIFLGFYIVTLVVYTRMGGQSRPGLGPADVGGLQPLRSKPREDRA